MAASVFWADAAWAQRLDAGRVYESVQPYRAVPADPAPPSVRQGQGAANAPALAAGAGVRLEVKAWRIVGAVAIPEAQLQRVLQPWTGQTLGVAQFQEAAGAVTQAYRDAGFIYSRAAVLPQTITDGVVTLTVREDRLTRLGLPETLPRFARAAASQGLPAGAPLDLQALQGTLLRVNRLPGAGRASAEVAFTDAGDSSELDIRYQPAERVAALARADNHGNRYTGSARLLGQVSVANPFLRADRLGATVLTAGAPMAYLGLGYAVPLSLGTTLDLAASALRYEACCQPVGPQSDGRARSTSAGLTFDAVVQRDRYLGALVAVEWRRLSSDLDGTPDTRRKVRTLKIGAQGHWLGAAVHRGSVGVQGGNADLGGHAPDRLADAAARQVEGGFAKWVLSYARTPTAGPGWAWSIDLDGQYNVSRNLESSERFSLGGPESVRAYAFGEGTGDSGIAAQLALLYRVAAMPGLTVSAFLDSGRTTRYTQNIAALTAGTPNSYTLNGAGVGMALVRPGFDLSLTVAEPLGTNRGLDAQGLDSEGRAADRTRAWLSLGLAF